MKIKIIGYEKKNDFDKIYAVTEWENPNIISGYSVLTLYAVNDSINQICKACECSEKDLYQKVINVYTGFSKKGNWIIKGVLK